MRLVLQLSPEDVPAGAGAPTLQFHLNGLAVSVADDGSTLLDVLRESLGVRSVKDGCSPQGQCGCCTLWVDGSPRVACVTPARRVAGRQVTTLEGLDASVRARWADAFVATGASQCGFCTPGILMRLAWLEDRGPFDEESVNRSLAAHLCRCTGWRTIVDAARLAMEGGARPEADRDFASGARRASLEGGCGQRVGLDVVLGGGGFADDGWPDDALVAFPDGSGGWVTGETLQDARAAVGGAPARNSTVGLRHPLEPPEGDFVLRLSTTFVEPAYLEPDASWCWPGGKPATPLANGGAFGGKQRSPVAEAARNLADRTGRPVRALYRRQDVVRLDPKRPPVAAGVRADGTGVVVVAKTPGSPDLGPWREALSEAAPGVTVEERAVPGPPVSPELRAAGWAEGAVLMAALDWLRHGGGDTTRPVTITSSQGASATVAMAPDGSVRVAVSAGDPLDGVVLRSYVMGAVHQGLGWVRSEGIAVDDHGEVLDLTIRSFGVLGAKSMPAVTISVEDGGGPALPAGDAVFAATAAAAWIAAGMPPRWPIGRGG